MLEHADGRDRVERSVPHVPVVLQADLDLALQPGRRDAVACGVRLRRAERHAEHPGSVVARRMQGEGTPAAADVEDPLPRPVRQPELVADEIVLGFLGRLQRVGTGSEPSAGIRHGGAEDHGVEVVADVVVVLHHLCIPSPRVEPASRCRLLGGRREWPADDPETARRLHGLPGQP